jgi:hypothetical protein
VIRLRREEAEKIREKLQITSSKLQTNSKIQRYKLLHRFYRRRNFLLAAGGKNMREARSFFFSSSPLRLLSSIF